MFCILTFSLFFWTSPKEIFPGICCEIPVQGAQKHAYQVEQKFVLGFLLEKNVVFVKSSQM
jgi:hypothetical protein